MIYCYFEHSGPGEQKFAGEFENYDDAAEHAQTLELEGLFPEGHNFVAYSKDIRVDRENVIAFVWIDADNWMVY